MQRLVLWSSAAVISTGAWASQPNVVAPSPDYRTDRILVLPKAGVNRTNLNRLHLLQGVKVLRTLEHEDNLQFISVPAGQTVSGLVEAYQRSGLVRFAEPDYLVRTAALPSDPKYLDGTLWGLNTIGAPQAWDEQASASNIVVAVLDTGARYTHQDLAANMWTSPVDHSHGLNALAGTTDPSDDSGHGTMIAGVLGAVGNNGLGVVGVAWQVQIMACKCFDKFGVGDIGSIITCLDYARTNQARLINASWGFNTNSLALSNALYRVQSDGIIVVAASGNITNNVDLNPNYPSSYHLNNVVSVGFTTRDDQLGPASNFGANTVHLVAPGDQIYSTFAATDNFYYTLSGSSMAAPYVTGALALILAKYPSEPYGQTVSRLLNGTDLLPGLAGKCITGGRLNLQKALSPGTRLVAIPSANPANIQFRIISTPLHTCVVQTSQDLVNWSATRTNVTSVTGISEFIVTLSSKTASQFYRTIDLP